MHGRRMLESAVCSFLLLLGALFVSPPSAQAQAPPPAPWSGVAANEASRTNGWAQGSNDMSSHSLSADGRYILFHSNISTLVPNDNNGWNDVFMRDRVTGELTRVSVASDGTEGNHYSYSPVISADGRYIAFYSCASNFDPTDTNGACDLFVHDRIDHTTTRQSFGPNGEQATEVTYQFRLSGNGRYLVFNASFDSQTWLRHVYLRDRDPDANGIFDEPGLSTTTQISESTVVSNQLGNTDDVAISNDARYIAYVAFTVNTNTSQDIGQRMYVHDRVTAMTFRVDLPDYGIAEDFAFASGPDFSDANHLAYATSAPLVETDSDMHDDVYVFNLLTGGNVLLQVTQLDQNPGAITYVQAPAISADGRYVAVYTSEGFPPYYSFWNYNVYGVDRQTLQSSLVSVFPNVDPLPPGTAANNASAPSITADGRGIGFAAEAGLLINGWGNRGVFVATDVAIASTETEVPETGGIYTVEVTAPATTSWVLEYGPSATVNISSGTGSATIQVTIAQNTSPDDVTTAIILGSEQVLFHQTAPPQIYYTMPYYGPTSGGTQVDIFGVGFAEGMTVEFGGTLATNVTFIDNGHIVATTPAHFGGWVSVKVTKLSGAWSEMEYMFYFDDTTPPIITTEVTGTLGANGWYTSDVSVTWTVVDEESTIGTEPCLPFSQTTDVSLTLASCYAESYGGGTLSDVFIKRDATPPVVIHNLVDHDFIQGQQVSFIFACNDEMSDIASCTASQGATLDTSTVGTHQVTVTAVDNAGLTTASVFVYNVKTFTSMSVPAVTSVYGGTATFSAQLLEGGAGYTPQGPLAGKTITFFLNNTPVGTFVTDANGQVNEPVTGGAAGNYPIGFAFAGDATHRPSASASTWTIDRATPAVSWATPSFIAAGTPLGASQLNASTPVPGTLVYDPAAGTVLAAGTHTLNVSFTPNDPANYNGATKSVTLKVKAVPVITWDTPAPIRFTQSLTTAQLNATANVAGTFVYNPPLTWIFNAPGPQTLNVTFTPTNTADYVSTSANVVLEVLKGIPTINFPPSDSISYTAALSATQLNATTQVPGTFTYAPPAGTLLPAGTHTLTATFTPTNQASWEITTATKSQVIYKATPSVMWDFPAPIPWGTPLGPQQQNATVNTPGTFTYYPAPGTIMEVGQHWITVSFAPDDTANWTTGSTYASLMVNLAPTTITWANPAQIVYGTPLGSTQLNATASVAGTISYSPGYATMLAAGTHTLTANFAPADTAHYWGDTKYVTIVVTKKTPTITWNNPAAIGYGTALSNTQLNAWANASGTFAYTPSGGTVLDVGTHTLSVNFTPSDPANNNPASATATLVVNKATPAITWPTPGGITYGTALSGTQLNASAAVAGTFEYSPAAGAVVNAGAQTLSVTFTPADTTHYEVATRTVTITVWKATPAITWANPSGITYGTALSSTQLNATSALTGTFVYSPAEGTVLDAGPHVLVVTFTPDSANYNPATANAIIIVAQATPQITWPTPDPIIWGTLLSATQLNATANIGGTFEYNPASGFSWGAGTHTLNTIFWPDSTNYAATIASTTLTVLKATPVITWANPAGVTYGTALSGAQLNATANVNGSFVYSPAAGTVLSAGTQNLSVTFTPDDPGNYEVATAGASIVVAAATPVITWANPAGITFGTALSGTQLNATANVPGSFAYSPVEGTVLGAGSQTLSVTFTPQSGNYASTSANVEIVVAKATPAITWATPSAITYGTALSGAQLNATANVNGSFVYSPAAGTVLGAGTRNLSVTFTPDDSGNYEAATAGVSIVVGTATPVITWANPAGITYGTELSGTQLNATANVPGSFVYSPVDGTVLGAGSQTLAVTFTPSDTNYATTVANVTIAVNKATPVITWSSPAGINYGIALSGTQLNATANVAGTFSYSPAAGTVPGAGTQSLSVTFTPTDAANYNGASGGNSIVVSKVALSIQTNNAGKVYGEALPAFTATGTGFVNGDSLASLSGTLSFSTSATATSAPGSYSVTPSGATSANYNITFVNGTLTVTKASTSVAFTTSPNPSLNNQTVQLRAELSAVAPGAGTPTGTVEFRKGTTLLGTATLVNGVATLNKSFKRGTHSLTATYVGNTNFNGSVGSVTHQTN